MIVYSLMPHSHAVSRTARSIKPIIFPYKYRIPYIHHIKKATQKKSPTKGGFGGGLLT